MSNKIAFSEVKQYLRSDGRFPINSNRTPDQDREPLTINQLQALELRRRAVLSDSVGNQEQGQAQEYRVRSREILKRSTEVVDYDVVQYLLTEDETINYQPIFEYLKENKIDTIPVVSSTPASVLDLFREAGFNIHVIPTEQVNLNDFRNVFSESEVPQWFKDLDLEADGDGDLKDIQTILKERWFLLFIVFLSISAAASFALDWSVNLPIIANTIDLHFSVYGAVAISRAVWQRRRAEEWNSYTRQINRSSIIDSFTDLLEAERPELVTPEVKNRLTELATESQPWDDFKKKLGIQAMEKPGSKKKSKKAREEKNRMDPLLDSLFGEEHTVQIRDTVIDAICEHMLVKEFGEKPPTVAIVIPTYQTSLDEMRGLLMSIKDQAYPVTSGYVIYNDDPNDPKKKKLKQKEFTELQYLVDQVNQLPSRKGNSCKIQLFAQPARGKREAMGMGFVTALGQQYSQEHLDPESQEGEPVYNQSVANLDLAKLPSEKHDYIINVDSDTQLADPFVIINSLLILKDNPDMAMLTGDVRVINGDKNLLTEMTRQRYLHAFFIERASQQKEVSCMSGPWVVMRSEFLLAHFDEWYFQTFLGSRTTYGDDRHLSTLALKHGYESGFCGDSAVETDCPSEWKVFLKQQLRWNKSFIRENYLLFHFIHKMEKFVQLDVAYQQTFPYVMMYILANITENGVAVGLAQGALAGLETGLPYGASVLLYNELFFGLYGALKNKVNDRPDWRFLLSPVYIGYHFGALLWLKMYAMIKLKDTNWGTKGETLTEAERTAIIEETLQDGFAVLEETLEEVNQEVALADDNDLLL